MACFFKDLTKKEKEHLKESGCTTLTLFKETVEYQNKLRKEYKERGFYNTEPCYECKNIARKLGLEVFSHEIY